MNDNAVDDAYIAKHDALVAKVKQFVMAWDKWDALMVVYAAELEEMVNETS